jgi:hypothetical protein
VAPIRTLTRRLTILLALAAALAFAAKAAAHTPKPGAPPCAATYPWRSQVTSIKPAIPELNASVLYCDDKLLLSSTSAKDVIVLGYSGEPYLRLAPRGVWTNADSPATYLNMSRNGVAPPPTATGEGKPRWIKVADSRIYAWHDHRIHWMGEAGLPAIVKKDPKHAHHVLDWQVPLLFGGERVVIRGRLDYRPHTRKR